MPPVGGARRLRCPATTPAGRRATTGDLSPGPGARGGDRRGDAADRRRSPRLQVARADRCALAREMATTELAALRAEVDEANRELAERPAEVQELVVSFYRLVLRSLLEQLKYGDVEAVRE